MWVPPNLGLSQLKQGFGHAILLSLNGIIDDDNFGHWAIYSAPNGLTPK
jgi:hypothetical protein